MKFSIVEFIPYFTVLSAFVLCQILQRRRTRKLMNKMVREVEKSRVLKEMLEIEREYKKLKSSRSLVDYPRIDNSLKEISIIFDKIGFNINLDNIKIVPIKSDEDKQNVEMLLKERERAPKEVQRLLDKKVRLINDMVSIKYPFIYFFSKSSTRLKRNAMLLLLLILLNVLITVINASDRIKNTFNNSNKPKSQKTITDPYIAMHCC